MLDNHYGLSAFQLAKAVRVWHQINEASDKASPEKLEDLNEVLGNFKVSRHELNQFLNLLEETDPEGQEALLNSITPEPPAALAA